MEKSLIQSAVSIIRQDILKKLKAVIDLDSDEAKSLASLYKTYHDKLALAHDRYGSVPIGYGVPEPDEIQTFPDYKLDRLYVGTRGIDNDADSMLSDVLQFREMNESFDANLDWRAIKFSGEYFQEEEKLNSFLSTVRVICSEIENKNHSKAYEIYKDLIGVKKTDTKTRQPEPLLSFEHYMDQFLKDGKEGNRLEKRAMWQPKLAQNHERSGKIFKHIYKGKRLDEITSKLLDSTFNNIIANLPRANEAPFNKMSVEEIIECLENGEIEAEQVISGKTAIEHRKNLYSFFKYVSQHHIIDLNPMDSMRTKISKSDSNKRGAFDNKTVNRIINYCSKESDTSKRWPVLVMAFSGMRNGEVMQLRKEDIKLCSDTQIYYMHVNREAGSVKTDSAIRRVPIHKELLKLGFIDFVTSALEGKLFNKREKYLTDFYATKIKVDLSIPEKNEDSKNLSLYSLRHTVITKLQSNNLNEAITQQIVGHRKSSSITSNYTHKFELDVLQKSLDEVVYS